MHANKLLNRTDGKGGSQAQIYSAIALASSRMRHSLAFAARRHQRELTFSALRYRKGGCLIAD
jgi:hypothetical protein